jgi:cytochrome c oxidase subunit II
VRARGLHAAVVAVLLLPLLAACGDGHLERFPQTTFAPVTEMARIQDDLFFLPLYLGVVVGIVVFAILGYIMWRFRYRPGMPEPAQVHGNTRLEIAWTLIPSIIVAVIAVPTVRGIFATQPVPPADAMQVRAIGKQWWWEFQYPVGGDTIVTANEIHVPVGTTIELLLESDNVLHSFWVPQMGGKRDMVPNRLNRLVFTPEQPGVYLGACAEFCGASHALMRMRLIAHTPEGFQDWLRNEAAPAVEPTDSASAVFLGKQIVTQGACIGCHAIRGTNAIGRTGPDLTHFGRRRTLAAGIVPNDAENLAAWLRDPPAMKPGSLMPKQQYTEEEISYMVAYLQSLQ